MIRTGIKSLIDCCIVSLANSPRYINMTVLPTELVDKLHSYISCSRANVNKPYKLHKYIYTSNDLLLAAWGVYPQLLLNIDNECTLIETEYPDELFNTVYCEDRYNEWYSDRLMVFYRENNFNIVEYTDSTILIPIKYMNKKILNHMLENKMCSWIVEVPNVLVKY